MAHRKLENIKQRASDFVHATFASKKAMRQFAIVAFVVAWILATVLGWGFSAAASYIADTLSAQTSTMEASQ